MPPPPARQERSTAQRAPAAAEPVRTRAPRPDRRGQPQQGPWSAFVPEIGDEAVRPREVGAPVPVIAHVLGRGLPDRLSHRAERRVRDDRWAPTVHPDYLVA